MTLEDMVEQCALTIRSGIELFHRIINPYLMRKEADARLYSAKKDIEIEQLKDQNYDFTMRKMPGMLHKDAEIHENIDLTWFLNFHDIVEKISDDDMQNIFAAILAGELESPGRCSIRTMHVIADLSRDEAMLFKKASGCIITMDDISIIPKQELQDEKNPLSYRDHLILEDCGLIQTSGISSCYRKFNGRNVQMSYQDYLLGEIGPNDNKNDIIIKIEPISKLTKAGEELYRILLYYGMAESNNEFFIWYLKRLVEKDKKLRVQLFRSKRNEGGNIVANGPNMIDMSVDDIKTLIENPAM